MDNGKIRIVCVDDHAVVREGLALIINLQSDMEVVGSAATADFGLKLPLAAVKSSGRLWLHPLRKTRTGACVSRRRYA